MTPAAKKPKSKGSGTGKKAQSRNRKAPVLAPLGPVGRLGHFAARNAKWVFVVWAIVAIGLGFFAPKAEKALSGAGWEATGSESVEARDKIFNGGGGGSYGFQVVVHSESQSAGQTEFEAVVARTEEILDRSDAVAAVVPPTAGRSISRDGHTVVVAAVAAKDPNEMVSAADELKGELIAAGTNGVRVELTGAAGMWSDFNEANLEAMLKSELISWPVTLAILVIAFGSLVAAGLPLMLTIVGLMAAAGTLYLGAQLFDISIWAMNFALMFALALGIDYALFIAMRFRNAFFGQGHTAEDAVADAMDTAGKAVLFSGLTVLISLSAVMLVPSPAFKSMALGIMVSVVFVLAASLTLLPAVLAKLGARVNAIGTPWVRAGEHRSELFARWGETLWRRPIVFGLAALLVLVALTLPVLKLDTGMPSIKVVPKEDTSRQGYDLVQAAFGPGYPGALQVVTPADEVDRTEAVLAADSGIAQVSSAQPLPRADGEEVIVAVPTDDPSSDRLKATIDRLREELPPQALIGGPAAENHDLETALADTTPLAIGVVLVLGFLLLLVAFQAPLVALLGVVTNLLAVGAAFGVAKWIFQDGNLSGLLGFESQGFLNAWGPIFFFAMIFAIAMDYTVFLLSSAREHWEEQGDPKAAMVGSLAHSGRVILAAAGVMVAVFFTFALSGPLPPKEMGVILGVAVFLDAFLVRLLLLPVLLRLTGKWAWYLPHWLDRVLPDIHFGHGEVSKGAQAAGTPPRRQRAKKS